MKIALLYLEPETGQPDAEDVRAQAAWIRESLAPEAWDLRDFAWPGAQPWTGLIPQLAEYRPDVVFNLVEDWPGDARQQAVVPGLMDFCGWACTGSSFAAIATATDKPLAKALLASAGLPTPVWGVYRGEADWKPPVFPSLCKPAWLDASLGIDAGAILDSPENAGKVLRQRWQALGGQPLLVEAWVGGREFNVSLRELPDGTLEVLPPAEIVFEAWPADKPRLIDYRAKWETGSFEYQHTCRRFVQEPDLARDLGALARACWQAFGLNGYARVDLRQDAQGGLQILEVNTNPCLAPDAGFLAAAGRAGRLPREVFRGIIETALRLKEKKA